jgi:hypothetical protein
VPGASRFGWLFDPPAPASRFAYFSIALKTKGFLAQFAGILSPSAPILRFLGALFKG